MRHPDDAAAACVEALRTQVSQGEVLQPLELRGSPGDGRDLTDRPARHWPRQGKDIMWQ